jgi:hypothetical protein
VAQHQIISLDESSFDTHMTQLYGWSKRGEKCIFYPKHSRRGRKRFSLMMATSNSRVVAWELLPLDTLLMDNVAFHHSKEVKQLLDEHHMHIIYNPPYYPDTNPVEMVFSMLKADARVQQPIDKQGIEAMIQQTCRQRMTADVLSRVFAHALRQPA